MLLRKNIFRDEDNKVLSPPNEQEIEQLDILSLDSPPNVTKITSTFENFDALDMAEIKYIYDIFPVVGKILVTASSGGTKEYVEWYSKRYHMGDVKIWFVGEKFKTKNYLIFADLSQFDLVETLFTKEAPYDLLIQDINKLSLNVLKKGGNAIIKCTYLPDKIKEVSKQFKYVHLINSSVNTSHVYLVCLDKGEEGKGIDNYQINLTFYRSYLASKTDTLNTENLAFTFDVDKINLLWHMPKEKKVKFSSDPQYLPLKVDIFSSPRFVYEGLKKAEPLKKIHIKDFSIKPSIENQLIVFPTLGYTTIDEMFHLLTPREKYFMMSFTKDEAVEIMLRDPTFYKRIYNIFILY